MSSGDFVADRNARTYDRIAPAYLRRWRARESELPRLERFATGLAAGAIVLDLGCGPGFDTAWLRARGLAAFGLDRSMGMLRSGRADYDLPRMQADMRQLPLADGCLAGVWANASLHHVARADLPAVLAELARALEPRGRLALSLKLGAGEVWEPAPYDEGGPRFYAYWAPDALDALLRATGFEIEVAREVRASQAADQAWIERQVARSADPR